MNPIMVNYVYDEKPSGGSVASALQRIEKGCAKRDLWRMGDSLKKIILDPFNVSWLNQSNHTETD